MTIIVDPVTGEARFHRHVAPAWSADFTVLIRLLPVNELMRKHWRARSAYVKQVAWGVHLALPPGARPARPLARARVRVERHGAGLPDPESLSTTIKPVLDVLQVRSRRHPYGLGVLVDDTEAVIGKPEVVAVKAPRGVSFFRVQLWDVSEPTIPVIPA